MAHIYIYPIYIYILYIYPYYIPYIHHYPSCVIPLIVPWPPKNATGFSQEEQEVVKEWRAQEEAPWELFFFTHETVGNHRKNSDQTSITGSIMAGWWFGTCFIFPYIGKNHPIWLIFFREVGQPPTRMGSDIMGEYLGKTIVTRDRTHRIIDS